MGPGGIYRITEDTANESKPFLSYRDIAAASSNEILCQSEFHYPTTPDAVVGGHFLYGFAGVVAEAEVNLLTGKVKVTNHYHTVAAGPVVNPMGYIGQIEGGSSMALGFSLFEDAVITDGRYATANLDTYLAPTAADMPEGFSVEAIEDLVEGDPYGPRGVGEIGSVGLAPAIAAAVRQATGTWVNRLPLSPETLIQSFVPHVRKGADSANGEQRNDLEG